jgi:hypothetical protein
LFMKQSLVFIVNDEYHFVLMRPGPRKRICSVYKATKRSRRVLVEIEKQPYIYVVTQTLETPPHARVKTVDTSKQT